MAQIGNAANLRAMIRQGNIQIAHFTSVLREMKRLADEVDRYIESGEPLTSAQIQARVSELDAAPVKAEWDEALRIWNSPDVEPENTNG